MAWTDLTFNFGAILTSAQMTQLDANFDALAAGDAGAPSIVDAALALPGIRTKIEEWVPTAVASKDFTWDEAVYSDIYISIEGIRPGTDAVALQIFFGYGNGATILTTNYDSVYVLTSGGTASGPSNVASPNIGSNIGNATNEGINGTVVCYGLTGAVRVAGAHFSSAYVTSAGARTARNGSIVCYDTAVGSNNVDTVQVALSSGNFVASEGKIVVSGLKR